jgi:2-octaprenyl-6-methoxyphenol hydroxylase
MRESSDVIILGGGLIGQTMALALARQGMTASVVDPVDPRGTLDAGFDGRVTAISSSSWRLFDAIGIGAEMLASSCPIDRIEVRDGADGAPLDFAGGDAGDSRDALGRMLENRVLRQTLWAAVSVEPLIDVHTPARAVDLDRADHRVTARLDTGATLTAPLVLVAEGRHSTTRTAAGIRAAAWDYGHRGIVCALDHTVPHTNTAHQIFFPTGPVALLPMQPGTRSALVWSAPAAMAEGLMALGERAFLAEVTRASGGLLGGLSIAAPRMDYPLVFRHAARMTEKRLALVGDAAHGIHPIAGQGFNLGLRDVAAMAEALVDGARLGLDLGDAQLLARYQRWRSLDVLAVSAACDALVRLFGVPGGTARAVRRFGLATVQRAKPLKAFFQAEARGESGSLPRMLQGELV